MEPGGEQAINGMGNNRMRPDGKKKNPCVRILLGFLVIAVLNMARGGEVEPRPPITFMEDGGWCWFQDPRAIISKGKLVIGGVSGQNGDIKISVYDLAENHWLGTKVLDPEFERDDHDAPALYVRPDGGLLAMWAKHGNEKIHHYALSSPDDYLEWGLRRRFIHEYEEPWGVTYMNLYPVSRDELLYNFFRDGRTYNPTFITSADHGKTWGDRTHFIADEVGGRHRPYTRYLQRDADTIGISFTEAHPRDFGNSLYYADFRDGAFFNVDGAKIKDLSEGPLTPAEAERIFQGGDTKRKSETYESVPNSAWTCATASDARENPHIGYTLYLNNDDHRFRIASWDGAQWIDREIAYAGKCLYPRESSYTGLMAFDPRDPTRVFISTDVNPSTGRDLEGTHEIFSADVKLNDSTASIQWNPLTANSEERNLRPIVVAGEGYKVLLWLQGPWNTYKDYNSDVVGQVLKRP